MNYLNCVILTCALALFVGCQTSQSRLAYRQHIPSEVKVDEPTAGRPTLSQPIQLPASDYFVVPFTIDRAKRWIDNSDTFTTGRISKSRSDSYPGVMAQAEQYGNIGISQSVRWHNAIIGKEGSAGKLVLDQRGVISMFEVVGPWVEIDDPQRDADDPVEWEFVPKAVLIRATLSDTDKDGQLTNQDADVLLAGDPNGAGLHPITPPNTKVWSTRYNTKLNRILIMVASDTNDDGLFTQADSAAPYLYTPGDRGTAKPMVDPRLTEQAERLLKSQ